MADLTLLKPEIQPISEETKLIAIEELRETPDVVEQGLRELRALLESDSSLYYHTDDEFLTIFLRPCKYYAGSAYKLMQRIADFKAKNSKIYDNLLPETVKEATFSSDIYVALVDRDQKRRRILLCRAKNWDPSKISTDQMLQMQYLTQLGSLLEPETQVRGFVVIVDCQGIGLQQVMGFTPSFAMNLLTFLQYALPMRLKEFHIINNPMIFTLAWNIVKPLLNKKSRERTFIHGKDIKNLHKYIAPSHLPEDLGGSLPKIWYTGKDWYPAIEDHLDFIRKWNACGRKAQS